MVLFLSYGVIGCRMYFFQYTHHEIASGFVRLEAGRKCKNFITRFRHTAVVKMAVCRVCGPATLQWTSRRAAGRGYLKIYKHTIA